MIIDALPSGLNFFSSSDLGVPKMKGLSNGDLLKVLDFCLIDGTPPTSVLSVVAEIDALKLNYSFGHGYKKGQIILVAGATNPQLNGKHRVSAADGSSVTLNVSGVIEETGVITTQLASLGWDSLFGDTTPLKRAYRSKSAQSAKRVLFLDMTIPAVGNGYHATKPPNRASLSVCADMQVIGVEIDSLTSSKNNFATNPNGSLFWHQKRHFVQSLEVSNSNTTWVVVGNEDFFFIMIGWCDYGGFAGSKYRDIYGFGEFISLDEGSQEKTFLMCAESPNDADSNAFQGVQGGQMSANKTTSSLKLHCTTPVSGFAAQGVAPLKSNAIISGASGVPYPSAYGGGLFCMSLKIYDASYNVIGVLPSILFIENDIKAASDCEIIDNVLTVATQAYPTSDIIPSSVGFYIGDE